MSSISQGAKFRAAIVDNEPLQIVGTINAYSAMMQRMHHNYFDASFLFVPISLFAFGHSSSSYS